MIIGSVTELKESENRVGLIPVHAKAYIDNNHQVIVESGLGIASGFLDSDYEAVGAKVLSSAKEVWDQADMIIKVKEPMTCEYPLMRNNQIIYTYFHLAANKSLTDALVYNKVKAVAYETVTNENNELVLLRPMSEIAGKLAILEGNKYLEVHYGGKGVLLSGATNVKPGHVVIVGVGAVGYSALVEAYNLGATITALVRNEKHKAQLEKEFDGKIEVLISTEENLISALKKADVIVSSVLVPGAKTEQLIKKEHLQYIEDGSVIIDVAIDQGGSVETSHPTTHSKPVYIVDGVLHYCVSNMAGAVPKTSSVALGSATVDYGVKIANMGLEQAALEDIGIYKGINVYGGHVVNEAVATSHNLEYQKLDIK